VTNSAKSREYKLIIKEYHWATQQEVEDAFLMAKGFEFELENVNFPLPDGVNSKFQPQGVE